MARYHDASRNLHRMEEQLYRAEYGSDYDDEDEYSDEDDLDEEYDEYEEEEEFDEAYSDEEEYGEEEDDRYYRRRPRQQHAFQRGSYEADESASVAPRQNRRVGKLLLLALAEILAIIAIVRWWIQWL